MNRALAGIFDPGGGRSGEPRRILTHALAECGVGHIEENGPLTLGFAGPADAGRTPGRPRCLLAGHVYNIADVARSLGTEADDPERVLERGFSTLGPSLLSMLRGDFAIVSWSEDGSGLLACDQLGGGTLVFKRDGRRLTFASEIRHLLPALPTRPGPDHASVAHWINVSGPPADRTMYAGVQRIRPGHFMRFGPEPAAQQRYWRARYEGTIRVSRPEAAAELRASIERAIERRAGPPGQTGMLLSGGLDSSSVAALAKRSLPDRAPTTAYSAVFPRHRSVDESQLIDQLARELGLRSVRVAVQEGSVLAGAVEYMSAWQLPSSSPNLSFWLPLLRQAAAEGVTVMLDGDGGDEMFALSGYLIANRLRTGRLLSAISLARQFPSGVGTHDARRVLARFKEFGLRRAVPIPAQVRRLRAERRGPRALAPTWFTDETARAYADTNEEWDWLNAPGPLWAAWREHTLTFSAGPVAAYENLRLRSQLAGLHPRHPLTDVDVIELMMRLPPEFSFDPALNRPLFREAVSGLVPNEVRLRPTKSYFDQVFQEALSGPDLAVARRLLTDPEAELRRYVDIDLMIGELLTPAPPPPGEARLPWATQVWRLMTAECWLRSQADPSFSRTLLDSGDLREPRYELLQPF